MDKKLMHNIKQEESPSHFCAFYDTREERMAILAAYYKAGLERGERCVFVTEQTPSDLIKELKIRGVDISEAVNKRAFMIFPISPTYYPDGNFRAPNMLANLKTFVDEAVKLKYLGVRGGGDMDWIERKIPGKQHVGEYESKINRFIKTNAFTGMCLFPKRLLNSKLVQAIVQTHQKIIMNKTLCPNPYYVAPEQSFKFGLELVAEIENWLDNLDEKSIRLSAA